MNNKELEKHIEDLTKQLEQAKSKLSSNKQRKVFSASFEWRYLTTAEIRSLEVWLADNQRKYLQGVSISYTGFNNYTVAVNMGMYPEQLAELAKFLDNM